MAYPPQFLIKHFKIYMNEYFIKYSYVVGDYSLCVAVKDAKLVSAKTAKKAIDILTKEVLETEKSFKIEDINKV